MKLTKENKIIIPSFIDINKIIKNYLFNNNEIILQLFLDKEEDEFKISLKGQSKNIDFFIDTKIAIEQHSEKQKHNTPHLQWDINQTNSDFFRSGTLRINLLVENKEELLDCCKGFIKIIGEMLEYFEKELNLETNHLLNYFFYTELEKFEKNKKTLHNFIEKAHIKDSFELKHKKSSEFELLNQNKKLFHIIRLFHEIPMLKPLLQTPCYNQFSQIPFIKQQNINFDEIELIINSLLKQKHEIEKYTPEKILIEFKKID